MKQVCKIGTKWKHGGLLPDTFTFSHVRADIIL
jgi:hypothetical protein